jgi:glutathione-specific gamma-glutamylcyclotransferase
MEPEAKPPEILPLTRANLETGRLRQLMAEANLDIQPLTEAELEQSLQTTLAQNPSSEVWLFAYGSLIWNPVIEFVDRQVGTLHGWHRRFCLWTPLGRGTPDNPGLMLGLDRGGSCRGVMYRISPEQVQSELMLVWRREMVVGSYIPRWVKVTTRSTTDNSPRYAIAFLINRAHSLYAGPIDSAVIIQHLATARGSLGSCVDYLDQTVASLAAVDIHDRGLLTLQQSVRLFQLNQSG